MMKVCDKLFDQKIKTKIMSITFDLEYRFDCDYNVK